MDLRSWLARQDGIAHRREIAAAGFTSRDVRSASLRPIGQRWVALESAPPQLATAASLHGRLTCVSAAERAGLAMLKQPSDLHVWVARNARAGRREGVRMHRAGLLAPGRPTSLTTEVVDVLSHVAVCLNELEALIVWDSALSKGLISRAGLQGAEWPGPRQRRLAGLATAASDSLLETIAAYRLRVEGIPFRQQVPFWGRPVDFLVDERVVLQIDGYEFHADSRQRRSDIEFDARLLAAGHPVIRRDYVGVVHEWPALARDLRAALLVAGRLHA